MGVACRIFMRYVTRAHVRACTSAQHARRSSAMVSTSCECQHRSQPRIRHQHRFHQQASLRPLWIPQHDPNTAALRHDVTGSADLRLDERLLPQTSRPQADTSAVGIFLRVCGVYKPLVAEQRCGDLPTRQVHDHTYHTLHTSCRV